MPRIAGTLRPRLTSSASIFERRGDPWHGDGRRVHVTPPDTDDFTEAVDANRARAGLKPLSFEADKKARQVMAAGREDPDYDQFTRAHKAQAKPVFVDPINVGTGAKNDIRRQITNLVRAGRREMAKNVSQQDARPAHNKPLAYSPIHPEAKIIRKQQQGLSHDKAVEAVGKERIDHITKMADRAERMMK